MCCLFLYNRQCIGFVCQASITMNTHELYYNTKVARVPPGSKKSPALLRFVGPRWWSPGSETEAGGGRSSSSPGSRLSFSRSGTQLHLESFSSCLKCFPLQLLWYASAVFENSQCVWSLSTSSSFWRIFLLDIESRLSFWFLLFNSLKILFHCLKICLHHPHFEGYFCWA